MIEYHILPEWSTRLEQAGLGTLESLLDFNGGKCLSIHKRGATFRFCLEDGSAIYIKRDHFTFKKEMAKDLLRLRWPAQKTVKERLAFEMARNAGIHAPEVIAWGSCTRFGLPHKAAFIMLEIPGTNLDEFVKRNGREASSDAIKAAEGTLMKMQSLGFDWPDHKPEHFIVMPDGEIAVIDLERMSRRKTALPPKRALAQLERFRRLLPH